ncbi:HET-domain-containing protein [Xylaria arbuscula]|nr:HET-domain-containing protein [Xylaria arbuscula]
MLCSVCADFNVRELLMKAHAQSPKPTGLEAPVSGLTIRPGITHFFKQHRGLLSLRSSASQCDLCRCIWEAYISIIFSDDCTDSALGTGDATLHGLPHLTVTQDGDRRAIRVLANFEVCALRGQEPVDHQHLLARSIYDNSGSPECLRFAAGLLENCLHNHKSCSSHNARLSQFPTRLFDVGGTEPKLVDGEGRRGLFAALSYCWGGETAFKLTSATEQSFRAGRPIEQFPVITRSLGIRYIWIDALCIFQDSDQDWALEASKMCAVYQGAVVTLAAACASNTHEGILRDRQASIVPKCWLDWRTDDATTVRVFLRHGTEIWDENFHQSTLNTRGWTLQETLLAPRTLWFGQQQIGFECVQGSISEAGRIIRTAEMYRSKEYIHKLRKRPLPLWRQQLLTLLRSLDIPVAMLVPTLSISIVIKPPRTFGIFTDWRRITLQGRFDQPATYDGLSHFDFWIQIIQNYTSRQLSFTTDVLPALSGLACEFHRATGDTYLAGLWKFSIIDGLSWVSEMSRQETKPITQMLMHDIAPSWSWASVLGSKVFFGTNSQFDRVVRFAKVLDITIHHSTPDPFGAVRSGSITLQAPFLDIGTDNFDELFKVTRGTDEYAQKHRGYDGQRYAILQLFKKWAGNEYSRTASKQVCFLLLESVENEAGCWRRVGLLRLTEEGQVGPRASISHEAILAEIGPDLKKQIVKIC